MAIFRLFLLIIIAFFFGISDGANILVINPSLSRSLLMQTGRLADILARDGGHNVTVWIPEMQPIMDTNATKYAQQVIRTNGLMSLAGDIERADGFDEQLGDYWCRLEEDAAQAAFCEALVKRKDELEIFRQSHFDVAFTNMIDGCFPGIVHYFGIKNHIWFSTGPIPDVYKRLLGIPQPLSIATTLQETAMLGPKMSTWERASNIWQYALSWLSISWCFWNENATFRKHISPNFPSLESIVAKIDLAFVYVDEFLEPALPSLDKVIPVGGIDLLRPPEKLNPDILRAVESGRKGAIFFSLGTLIYTNQLDQEKWGNLLRTFAHFEEYSFLVRISPGDEQSRILTAKMANVHLFEWLPQKDLLSHPNIRLFISHAGYNSILEATVHGVPILAIPLFFDQKRNAKSAEYRGHTRVLAKRDLLDEDKIRVEIDEMLENPSYKKAASRLAKLFREKPHRPEQSLLNWTNFVISNGPLRELMPESVGMGLVEYFCLDIAFYAIAVMALILMALAKLIMALWRRIGKKGKNSLPKQKNKKMD